MCTGIFSSISSYPLLTPTCLLCVCVCVCVCHTTDVIDVKGYDIFGNTQQSLQKNVDCQCPNCERTLGAAKFAPHLEKCMGMGRNSTRLANRK